MWSARPVVGRRPSPAAGTPRSTTCTLAIYGYPISDEIVERLEDGREYTVQCFERARFEHHPPNTPPNDVLLGQFGRIVLAALMGR